MTSREWGGERTESSKITAGEEREQNPNIPGPHNGLGTVPGAHIQSFIFFHLIHSCYKCLPAYYVPALF